MEKLIGKERDAHTSAFASEIRDTLESDFVTSEVIPEVIPIVDCSASISPLKDDNISGLSSKSCNAKSCDALDLEVKKEEVEIDAEKKKVPFTPAEDADLKKGYVKYAHVPSKWARILRDKDYTFQDGRTRDSLRVRAKTLKLSTKKKVDK